MSGNKNTSSIQNAELSAICDSAREAIITRTLEGVVTRWNRAAERMFGYTADEVLGKPIDIIVPAANSKHESEIVERIRRGERTEDYETKRLHKDGRIISVSVTFSPMRDEIGHIVGVLTVENDVSERKRFEAAERDRLFLASIVSSADDAIVSKDLYGIVTSWNKSAESLFGYTAEEMIGKPIEILIPRDHPDEEPQILERIRRGERIEHYETRRRRKDGRIIDVSITISPIRDSIGRVIGASKIARDITERKRWQQAEVAESFLGALVESAEDAIISKNLDGTVTTWNHGAEMLFGYTAAEIIGKPITILIPQAHADEEPQILTRIRRGERMEHYETTRVRKDGRSLQVSQTISPIRDSLGQVIGVSNITRDITEQKRAERRERETLRQAQKARLQAEEASSAKDNFLATISHELRTPITAILGWSRILMSGQISPDRQRKALETIDRNARSQAQLIEDLLDISRIVSGRLRIEFKPVDLPTVIAAAVEAVRPAAEAKQIRIQTVLSSGAGPILGDAERLQQVMWNLLSNAIKFTPKDGSVQIQVQRIESQVELLVTDTGIGIKPEFLPHLFERFTQADPSITRSTGGLGMGLAIVKSLVELHGGVISATSDGESKGSTFVVKFPISAVRHIQQQQPYGQKRPLPVSLKSRDELVGLKILVVDDEPDTCDLLRFIFNETGAIVETATSAEEGWQLFDTWQPDMLVSDIGMPDVDGFEFIRIIREERHSRIPAIALTALVRIEDRVKALTAGYQMHVPKPVEPLELISVVASLVALVDRRTTEESN
jgi:PAS domain S-box-containing protein